MTRRTAQCASIQESHGFSRREYVNIAICHSRHGRPHTTRHPFREPANARAFIDRRIGETTAAHRGWRVLSDIDRVTDAGVYRTVAIAYRNEVVATLRMESRRFQDHLQAAFEQTLDGADAGATLEEHDMPPEEE